MRNNLPQFIQMKKRCQHQFPHRYQGCNNKAPKQHSPDGNTEMSEIFQGSEYQPGTQKRCKNINPTSNELVLIVFPDKFIQFTKKNLIIIRIHKRCCTKLLTQNDKRSYILFN